LRPEHRKSSLEKAVARIQSMVGSTDAQMPAEHMIMLGEEMVLVTIVFSIRSAWVELQKVKIHVTVDGWTPQEADLSPDAIEDLVTKTLEADLDWMALIPWSLSVDRQSVNRLRRSEAKQRFILGITQPIAHKDIRQDEAVEVLAEILTELRPELSDVLTSHCHRKRSTLVRIEGRGLPCPICLGHLSEDAIFSLYHRLRMEKFGDDAGEE
jgi:hypothetical protein